jgi:hypothetical protein
MVADDQGRQRQGELSGGARHKPSNHCAGKAGVFPLNLYDRVRSFSCSLHTRPLVQRAPGFSLRPLFFGGAKFNPNLGRLAPRECEFVSINVIASQRIGAKRRPMTGSVKQPISPCKERKDCFVASRLAMTVARRGWNFHGDLAYVTPVLQRK